MLDKKVLGILFLACCTLFGFQYEGDDYVDFTAYLSGDKVNIHWTAAPRDKIESFGLERSQDGKEFKEFRRVYDDGSSPKTAEFVESDFKPMLGWSYYRIVQYLVKGKEIVTHSVPVFYHANRMKKGEMIVPDQMGDGGESSIKAAEFNNQELVFVLRNNAGEEFYYEATLTVANNTLYLPASDQVPAAGYMITACTKTALLGLEVTVQ